MTATSGDVGELALVTPLLTIPQSADNGSVASNSEGTTTVRMPLTHGISGTATKRPRVDGALPVPLWIEHVHCQ